MISKELKVLEILNKDSSSTQRDIAEKADISVGNVNYIIKKLFEGELIKIQKISRKSYYMVTDKGIEALEEHLKTSIDKKIIIPQGEGRRVNQAVILAAGQRAGFDMPVGFLKLGDTTVIERTINILKKQGIGKIIIITGYESNYYKELAERYEVQLVNNEKYKYSGTMYSLALVEELVDEDFILIESDLIFEEKAIAEIIGNENRDCVLITSESGSGDEVLVEIRNGFLFKISKDIHAFSNIEGEMIGITKISIDIYNKMLEDFRGSNNAYQNYEYVLLDVARTYNIGYVKLEDLIWTEIDTTRDYKNLTNYVYPILNEKEKS